MCPRCAVCGAYAFIRDTLSVILGTISTVRYISRDSFRDCSGFPGFPGECLPLAIANVRNLGVCPRVRLHLIVVFASDSCRAIAEGESEDRSLRLILPGCWRFRRGDGEWSERVDQCLQKTQSRQGSFFHWFSSQTLQNGGTNHGGFRYIVLLYRQVIEQLAYTSSPLAKDTLDLFILQSINALLITHRLLLQRLW